MCELNSTLCDRDNFNELRKKFWELVRGKIDIWQHKSILIADMVDKNMLGTLDPESVNQKLMISITKRSANFDFDISKSDREMFCDRLEQYFIANKVIDKWEKKEISLSKVNAETYGEIAKICKPAKLKEKIYE